MKEKLGGSRFSLFLFFLVWLFTHPDFVSPADAKIYYVDNKLGADCTSGNYSIAKRACGGSDGDAWDSIQEAVNKIDPGDTILVRGGTYRERVNVRNGNSGTASAYKTLKTYNREKVVWDGNSSSPTDIAPLKIQNSSFWQIGDIEAGFTITDNQANRCISAVANNNNHTVTCEGQSKVAMCGLKIIGNTLDDCGHASGTDMQALLIAAHSSSQVSRGHLIKGNTITNFARHGINIRRSRNSIVEDNIIDNKGSMKIGGGWVGIACTNPECVFNIIRRNTVRNLDMSSGGVDRNPIGIWLDWQASDNIISDNIVHTMRGGNRRVHNGRGIFLEAGVKRNKVSNNLVYNVGTGYAGPSGPGGPAEDNVVENNKFVNNTNYGICLTNTRRMIVRNNELTGNGIGALMVVRPGSYSSGTPLTGSDKPKFENNRWPRSSNGEASLTYQEASGKSVCYMDPDRTLAELSKVATSEHAREGIGEFNILSRMEDALPTSALSILPAPTGLRLLGSN